MNYPHALDVVNEALAMLGQTKLMDTVDTAHSDPIWRALACMYDSSREEVLLAHPWNFALREMEVYYKTRVQIPADCLRILAVHDEDGVETPHRRIGNELKCDRPVRMVRYLANDDEPNTWDRWVRQALVHRLASKFARPLKGSMQERQLQDQAFASTLQEAKNINSGETYGKIQNTIARDIINGKRD